MIIRPVDLESNNIKLLLEDNPTLRKEFLLAIRVSRMKLLPAIFVFLCRFHTLIHIRSDVQNNFLRASTASHCVQQMASLQELVLKRLNFSYKYL